MTVPCEGPIGMTLVGTTGACAGRAPITPRSDGPTAQEVHWEGTEGKAVGLNGANGREV